MHATTTQRVTSGKSAIHGWGAFAKARHAAGAMVVEYAGAWRGCVLAGVGDDAPVYMRHGGGVCRWARGPAW